MSEFARPEEVMTKKPPADARLLTFARDMRREPTDAERKLWQRLRNRQLAGFKFRRQVPFAGYVLDFYCDDAKLSIELDGGQHNDPKGLEYDEGRTKALDKLGIRVLRFWDPDVLKDIDAVLERVLEYLHDPALQSPSP
jgi:very-short-patch-repair endonuclease